MPALRRFMPYLMPNRNQAAVYFEQTLEIDHTLDWCEERGVKLFDVILAALVRVFAEREQIHRFVAAGRLWQRKHIELAFAVKKVFEEKAPITTMKVRFEPEDDIDAVRGRVRAAIGEGRSEKEQTSETEMRWITKLPGFVVGFLLRIVAFVERIGLLPRAMIDPDPLYSSALVVNLGSVGIDAAYHHMFDRGTAPICAVLGKIKKVPLVGEDDEIYVGRVAMMRYAYDERIADGFYAARSLERFKELVEKPELLTSGDA